MYYFYFIFVNKRSYILILKKVCGIVESGVFHLSCHIWETETGGHQILRATVTIWTRQCKWLTVKNGRSDQLTSGHGQLTYIVRQRISFLCVIDKSKIRTYTRGSSSKCELGLPWALQAGMNFWSQVGHHLLTWDSIMESNMRSILCPRIRWMCTWLSSFCRSSKMSWRCSSGSQSGVGGGDFAINSASISKSTSVVVDGISIFQLGGIYSSTMHPPMPKLWSRVWALRGEILGWKFSGGVSSSGGRISSLIGQLP